MGVELFRVLAASGGFVNGIEVAIGADVPLTEAEARYEIDAGTVARTGQVPVLPIIPAVLPTDLVPTTRGAFPRAVPMASIELYLAGEDSVLSRALAARGDAIGAYVAGEVEASLAVLRGDAGADADTLGKLVALIARERGRLDTVLHGSVADLDTFLEAYNRFVADEGAAATMNAALASLRAAFDEAAVQTVSSLRGKADLDTNGWALASQIAPALIPSIVAQILTDFRNSLPPLPASDADIPDAGGWFLNAGQPFYIPPKA